MKLIVRCVNKDYPLECYDYYDYDFDDWIREEFYFFWEMKSTEYLMPMWAVFVMCIGFYRRMRRRFRRSIRRVVKDSFG